MGENCADRHENRRFPGGRTREWRARDCRILQGDYGFGQGSCGGVVWLEADEAVTEEAAAGSCEKRLAAPHPTVAAACAFSAAVVGWLTVCAGASVA